jgi:hypothetical protein
MQVVLSAPKMQWLSELKEEEITHIIRMECPECRELDVLARNGRCKFCTHCGWSSCDI